MGKVKDAAIQATEQLMEERNLPYTQENYEESITRVNESMFGNRNIFLAYLVLRCNKDYKQGIDDMSGVNESMFGNRNIFLAYLVFAATRTSISSGTFFESCYPD